MLANRVVAATSKRLAQRRLTDLFILRGTPAFTRSDKGSEFFVQAVRNPIASDTAKIA